MDVVPPRPAGPGELTPWQRVTAALFVLYALGCLYLGMDPVMVVRNYWVWQGGWYFGVPLGN